MLNNDMSLIEIGKELEGKGDFIRIDYLTRYIEQRPPMSKKKFAFNKLLEIYESKNMFNDAAKIYHSLAMLTVVIREKIDYLIKASKAYIKGGNLEKADLTLGSALTEASDIRKQVIYEEIKNFYKKQAEIYEKESKRNHSVKIYEKILDMKISDEERKEIKEKLLQLYEGLGKFRESSVLKEE